MIEDLRYQAPLGKNHHCSLVFKFMCYAEYVKQCKNVHVGLCQGHSGDYEKRRALVRECDLSVVEYMPMEDGQLEILRRQFQNGHEQKHSKVKP